MVITDKKMSEANVKMLPKALTVCLVFMLFVQFNSYALESNVELHKGSDADTYGYSLGISDSIVKQGPFHWRLSYNRLADVVGTADGGNETSTDFTLDTVDALLTYRYSAKTYNRFLNKLTYEFQVGAAVSLTENKFIWTNQAIEHQEMLSESGDINAVVALSVSYKMSKATSMHIGLKHYPDYSEFGSVSSIFIGFNYHFGRQIGY